jgi:hypothetical protein
MSSVTTTTNFKDSNGADLGTKLVTKDYLISVYPGIAESLGISPELWTWGEGFFGVNGNFNTANLRTTPVTTFAGGTNWKQVSAGHFRAAATKTDGTLWTWGAGDDGSLGSGANFSVRETPITTFAGGTNWRQVSVGYHMSAIKTDGTLWTWGGNFNGQLGNSTVFAVGNRSTPVTTFAGGTNWRQVSSGFNSTAAIKTDGTLWTWGINNSRQLGNAGTTSAIDISTPVTTFAGGTNWKQVSANISHMAAIKTDGTLWTWGAAYILGNGIVTGNRSTPVTTFAGGTNWKQVGTGGYTTAAIKTDGTLWVWGFAARGVLGNGITTGDISTPITTFAGGTNWKQVACGQYHMSAIKTDGTLWTWGYTTNGILGNATGGYSGNSNVSTPITTFAGGTNWKQVHATRRNTLAIKSVDF